MTPEETNKNRQWNERVRLLVNFFNLIAVGTFGVGVAAPLTDKSNPLYDQWALIGPDKLNIFKDFSLTDVISWQFVIAVIGLHISAHILIGLLEPEE